MIERLPERVRTPAVARAITSPSAMLLAGAGMSAAILGGLPIAAAAVIGGLAWAARVAFAVPRRPAGERIDAFRVGEPWRGFVIDAQQAQARFERTVSRMRSGPLRERLNDVGRRLAEGVTESWRIARQGDALQGAYHQLDVRQVEMELAEIRGERRASRDDEARDGALERTETALEAQLASAERIRDVARDAADRLRVLNAQLDEAVARAVELSVRGADADISPLTNDVDNIVGELEALRQGLEETGGATMTA